MKMTTLNIRDATLRAARSGKRVEVSDDEHPGLELGISPSGVQTWSLRTHDPSGRLRRFGLGHLPTMTPAAARKAARSLRARVETGYDPIAEKRVKRMRGAELRSGIGTLGALLDQFERAGNPPKTWFTGSGRKRVERVFRELMLQPVRDMKASDVLRVADTYAGSPSHAQNAIRALRPVLSWAVRRDHAPAHLIALRPEQGVRKRARFLSPDELRRVLPFLRSGQTSHARVMMFALLTLCRLNEVAGAKWMEIDFYKRTWTIPPDRLKDTRGSRATEPRGPFVVPLSSEAIRLLRSVQGDGAPDPQALVFPSSTGTLLGNWDRVQKSIFKATGTAGWHRHDLRRTGATMLGKAGVPPHVVAAALNHATISTNVSERYNTARYSNEVKEALQALSVQYTRLISVWQEEPNEWGEKGWALAVQEFGAPPLRPVQPPAEWLNDRDE